jgi:hypothetical protein
MATFADIAAQALPQNPEITFLFTTRKSAPWVKSCHAQHLRATRLTDDQPTYQRAFLPHTNLDAIAAHPLITAPPLEDAATHHFGPAAALLDVMQ